MSQDLNSAPTTQLGFGPPVPVQQRVQFAILMQFAENQSASRLGTAAVCPGTDQRDFEVALRNLVEDGSLDGPSSRLATLVDLAEGGWLTLTNAGRLRLHALDD